jgi:hypothetical protein
VTESERKRWGPPTWTVWGVSAAVGLVIALFACFVIIFKVSPTCSSLATHATVRTGLTDLAIAALILAGPWLLATLIVRARWRLMLIGFVITVAPIVVTAVTHTDATDWNGGRFC